MRIQARLNAKQLSRQRYPSGVFWFQFGSRCIPERNFTSRPLLDIQAFAYSALRSLVEQEEPSEFAFSEGPFQVRIKYSFGVFHLVFVQHTLKDVRVLHKTTCDQNLLFDEVLRASNCLIRRSSGHHIFGRQLSTLQLFVEEFSILNKLLRDVKQWKEFDQELQSMTTKRKKHTG